MIVTAWNPGTDSLEKTNTSAAVNLGDTSLTVKNADRFSNPSKLLIGEPGYEQSEIVTVSGSVTTTNIPLSAATKFAHNPNEPVYALLYDQIQFYSSLTITGSKTLLATLTIDVDNADLQTLFDDTTGSPSTYYWTRYYNSTTFEESDYSDYVLATGPAQDTIGRVIQTVVRRIKDPGYTVLTPEDYIELGQEVNDDLESQSARPFSFGHGTVPLNRVAGQAYVDLPGNYSKFDWLEYDNTFGGVTTKRRLTPIPLKNFIRNYSPASIYQSDSITTIALDDDANRILLKPTPKTSATGVFQARIFTTLDPITAESNVVQTPNSLIYKYKFLAEAYTVKAERDPSFGALATKYETKYGQEVVKLSRMNHKDVGSARSFNDSQSNSSSTPVYRRRYTLE